MLSSSTCLACTRMKRAPFLTKLHLEDRAKFARNFLEIGTVNWHYIVFSDEKKFKLNDKMVFLTTELTKELRRDTFLSVNTVLEV